MLGSHIRQVAILFRISVALVAVGVWSHAIAGDEPKSKYFFDGLHDEVVDHLCNDQHFLDTGKLSVKACKDASDVHSEECRTIVESLETELLDKVFVLCLQYKILFSGADINCF
jgi:hypothetical protein